jgi:hypothetical protein
MLPSQENYTLSYILAFCSILILSALLCSYMGQITMDSFSNVVEGFQSSESGLDKINNNISESVTEMDDSLRVDKYRSEYSKMLSLSKDYLQQQKLGVLFSFKDIDLKKLQKDPKQGMQQLQNLAFGAGINLFLMERGIKGIDSISL